MLLISIVMSILLVGSTAFSTLTFNGLASSLTIFCIWPLFAIFTMAALIYAPLQWRKNGKRSALPLLVSMTGALVTYGILLFSWSSDLSFYPHLNGFNKVIGLIETNQIQPDKQDNADLPLQFKYLSESGSIRIHKENDITSVLFYGSRGILGEFWGYAYRSDNSPPTDFLWCDNWRLLRQPQTNWFVCESH
jgi:hypothetical protein